MANWIKGAIKHPGVFKKAAQRADMSTSEYASHVLADKNASPTLKRRASLAKTLGKLRPKKRSPFKAKI